MAVIQGVSPKKWCLSSGVEHRIANPVVMSSILIGTFFFGYEYLKCIYITSSQRALQMFIYLFEYLYSLLLLSSIFRSFLSLSFSLSSSLSLTSSFIFSPLLFFNYWYLCGKSVQLRVTNATTQNSRASFCFPSPPISF